MAMLPSTLKGRVLRFNSDAENIGRNALQIIDCNGREALSEPYRFDITLLSTDPEIDSAELLTNPAYIGIKQGVDIGNDQRGIRTLRIHGVLSSFSQREEGAGAVLYRATLVPRLWKLNLNFQTRVFLDKTVPDIVEEILKELGLSSGSDYEMKTTGRTYPTKEYVVQYQESDLNFLSRICEHEGIFYFFQQGEDEEKVVFADSSDAYEPIVGTAEIPYHPVQTGAGAPDGRDWFGPEVVDTFEYRHVLTPADVKLKEYNYTTPDVTLEAEESTGTDGYGTYYDFGSNFADEGEGKSLAEVRAQEIKCREKVYKGTSDVRNFAPGATFTMVDHYRFNHEYLIVEVHHRISQALSLTQVSAPIASYKNDFVCISSEEMFRPKRVTPKPKIVGTLPAIVTSSGSAQYAEVDDAGRYSVTTPWDAAGGDTLNASVRVRKAEPHAGASAGFHIPSRPGTEVAMVHLEGNPDRPTIMGTLAKPGNDSPVTSSNFTQAVWKTEGNNEIHFDDQEGSEDIYIHAQKDHTISVENNKSETIGSDNSESVGNDETIDVTNNRTKTVGVDQSETIGSNKTISVGVDHTETIGSNMTLTVGADRTVQIGANDSLTIGGTESITIALTKDEKIGLAASETVGLAKSVTVGAAYSLSVGAIMDVSVAGSKSESVGGDKSESVGGSKQSSITGDHAESTSGEITITGDKSITISASEDIILKSPKASLMLKKSGEILLEGKDIQINGSDIDVKGSGNVIVKGKKISEN